MPQVKPEVETFAKIKVIGVGGSGGSAIDRMVKAGIRGVDFMVMNTDVQALHHNSAPHKLHIGKTVTRGLGAGMNPEVGQRSAEESQNEIREALKETDMVFVTCGLGGGTGSGASPVIAEIAREMGALTVGVVTKPFSFEGPQRKAIAEKAYRELSRHVDTIITIPNDRVLQIIDKKTSLLDAFKIVDDVLRQGVQGISELITVPGLINVDFADVKSIMKDRGSALMGIGVGSGDTRAVEAAQAAISSPLLEVSIDGARGILFTITGGTSLGMQEVAEAAKIITSSADDDVRVIFGAVVDESMGEEVRVTVIATGFEEVGRPSRGKEFESIDDDVEELHAPFPLKKPMYSNNLFSKRQTVREEESEHQNESMTPVRSTFTTKPVSSVRSTPPSPPSTRPSSPPSQAEDSEEDLEIPAFIRKKMGM
ncbi:MAG: Cell division protein FtsZ [Candidatus Magasanikbacteria bacterium GW2011_GWD2_43_18]|uniref:Cell division protein FtsZ n=1 Tax=Candidatus Magasanikbacteria bacterium GW2011_GWE2_42_7 TaxID=1619052 RepID=A0A0G1EBM8_9BACT|nr:MAG: Cell division protein FtsZ [Candidatus Magasanikbacteria bacterium GW2011_GWC2_42_27]KKS72003.1 MAG: Cell division protein FtsZ [Candidatus Magasanikbacteria bacterium GW2011_GWE2_42_7]KKT04842.1 MAG: Cell division protein FtsZ [Candidatus Magasanikbacteria bacterium GW2011_GWD2_43_18]KKT25216.1 MAG: Cell division protein FtsZ [Candidatus Magasanikbacteria bacterium GW2011_GWA2_43_9]HBB37542.1 cell division protein FtsZ [Candidatus Magasanikbacteria bacterium]